MFKKLILPIFFILFCFVTEAHTLKEFKSANFSSMFLFVQETKNNEILSLVRLQDLKTRKCYYSIYRLDANYDTSSLNSVEVDTNLQFLKLLYIDTVFITKNNLSNKTILITYNINTNKFLVKANNKELDSFRNGNLIYDNSPYISSHDLKNYSSFNSKLDFLKFNKTPFNDTKKELTVISNYFNQYYYGTNKVYTDTINKSKYYLNILKRKNANDSNSILLKFSDSNRAFLNFKFMFLKDRIFFFYSNSKCWLHSTDTEFKQIYSISTDQFYINNLNKKVIFLGRRFSYDNHSILNRQGNNLLLLSSIDVNSKTRSQKYISIHSYDKECKPIYEKFIDSLPNSTTDYYEYTGFIVNSKTNERIAVGFHQTGKTSNMFVHKLGLDSVITTVPNGVNPNQYKVNIYPNPSNTNISLSLEKPLSGRVMLSNLLGQKIAEYELKSGRAELPKQAAGTYIYQIQVGNDLIAKGKLDWVE